MAAKASEPRHDLGVADAKQAAIPFEPSGMGLRGHLVPVELGRSEGGLGLRVGDALPRLLVLELREFGELLAPPLAHGVGELADEIAEEWERLRSGPFLAHEQHRYLRQKQVHRRDGAHRLGLGDGGDALAEGAVADLVVILNEGDEGGGGQTGAGLAPRLAAVLHRLALEDEALRQRPAEFLGIADVVGIIPLVLAGGRSV